MSNPTTPAPGWYPDPDRAGAQRWWDGNAWGPLAPTASPATPPPPAAIRMAPATPRPGTDKKLGTAYLLGVFIIGSHRIYLGKIGSGIVLLGLWYVGLFLLLFGVPAAFAWVPVLMMIVAFVWWFIDLIRMRSLVERANRLS